MSKLIPSYIDKDHISSSILTFEDLKENIFVKRFSKEQVQEHLIIISRQEEKNSFLCVMVDIGVGLLDINIGSFERNDYYTYMVPSEGTAYSMDKWPNIMVGAYLISRFVNKVGGIYNSTDSIRHSINEFRSIVSSSIGNNLNPLESERVMNYFSKGIASSLMRKTKKKKEEPILTRARSRRLRKHFHEGLLKKKDWSAQSKAVGIKLPTSSIQIKRVLNSHAEENEMRYSRTPLSGPDVEQILRDLKYPAFLVTHKNSDKEALSKIPGYILLDCSILPKHFAAKGVDDYIILIKRGANIFDLEDSVDPRWHYGIVKKQLSKVKKIKPVKAVVHATTHAAAGADAWEGADATVGDEEENTFGDYIAHQDIHI